eukprot:ctg_504.g304
MSAEDTRVRALEGDATARRSDATREEGLSPKRPRRSRWSRVEGGAGSSDEAAMSRGRGDVRSVPNARAVPVTRGGGAPGGGAFHGTPTKQRTEVNSASPTASHPGAAGIGSTLTEALVPPSGVPPSAVIAPDTVEHARVVFNPTTAPACRPTAVLRTAGVSRFRAPQLRSDGGVRAAPTQRRQLSGVCADRHRQDVCRAAGHSALLLRDVRRRSQAISVYLRGAHASAGGRGACDALEAPSIHRLAGGRTDRRKATVGCAVPLHAGGGHHARKVGCADAARQRARHLPPSAPGGGGRGAPDRRPGARSSARASAGAPAGGSGRANVPAADHRSERHAAQQPRCGAVPPRSTRRERVRPVQRASALSAGAAILCGARAGRSAGPRTTAPADEPHRLAGARAARAHTAPSDHCVCARTHRHAAHCTCIRRAAARGVRTPGRRCRHRRGAARRLDRHRQSGAAATAAAGHRRAPRRPGTHRPRCRRVVVPAEPHPRAGVDGHASMGRELAGTHGDHQRHQVLFGSTGSLRGAVAAGRDPDDRPRRSTAVRLVRRRHHHHLRARTVALCGVGERPDAVGVASAVCTAGVVAGGDCRRRGGERCGGGRLAHPHLSLRAPVAPSGRLWRARRRGAAG